MLWDLEDVFEGSISDDFGNDIFLRLWRFEPIMVSILVIYIVGI